MGRRAYRKKIYKRKSNSNEFGILIIFIVIFVVTKLLKVIEEEPEIIIGFLLLPIFAIFMVLLIKVSNQVQIEKRKLEIIKSNRTIGQLLLTYRNRPTDFEYYVANVFDYLGYKTQVTPPTGDCGKDIIMYKDGYKYVVEVKLYKESSKINRGLIQKLHSAKIDSSADKAIFITSSSFTKNSIDFAERHRITLIDGHSFVSLIDKAIQIKEKNTTNAEGAFTLDHLL